MDARLLPPQEHHLWDSWLRTIEGANVRQTSIYCQALELYKSHAEILVTADSGSMAAGALLALRKPAFFVGPMIRTSGGLALSNPSDPEPLRNFLQALLDYCSDVGASIVEIQLRIPQSIGEQPSVAAVGLEDALRALKFSLVERQGTYQISLVADSDDELLERFPKNLRRDIRKALREGVQTERSVDPVELMAFQRAHNFMSRRKQLGLLPDAFSSEVLRRLIQEGWGHLFLARFNGRVRNYVFVGAVNQPIYHWGALTEAALEPHCPPTGQAIQYGAMCHFRALGKNLYDLGGSPGPVPDPAHQNFGVWKFKYDFRGTYVCFVGQWRRTLKPLDVALIDVTRRILQLKSRLIRR